MVSFSADGYDRVASGEITVTWRLWKYAHVKRGKTYATGWGYIEVEDVRLVPVSEITDADALSAGFADAASLVAFACSHTGATPAADTALYRVQFHTVDAPPKPALPLEEIEKRLAKLDAASPAGPWTLLVLRLIEREPGVVSTALARETPFERFDFKARVRKLKALGLTESLAVGYELSELGQAYLDYVEGKR